MEEVKLHKTDEDAWTVLRGHVYNISPYLGFHPGGNTHAVEHVATAGNRLERSFLLWRKTM